MSVGFDIKVMVSEWVSWMLLNSLVSCIYLNAIEKFIVSLITVTLISRFIILKDDLFISCLAFIECIVVFIIAIGVKESCVG